MSGPGSNNELSKQSSEMTYPSWYANKDWGKATKIVKRKVTNKNSGDPSKTYGSKAIMTKEEVRPTFVDFLIQESDQLTALPDSIIGEIKKHIGKGARDMTQKWKNTLELVHKAYQVSNVRRPTPDQKGGWKQYIDLLKHGVSSLAGARGLNGAWRTSQILVRESEETVDSMMDAEIDALLEYDQSNNIGKKRFFVEIPGERAQEVDGKNMDEIIDAISNKIRNTKHVRGTKVRVEERTKEYTVLVVLVDDVVRERITIKLVS